MIDFDIELTIEELEARASSAMGEHLLARWRAHLRGGSTRIGLAPALTDLALARRLRRMLERSEGCPAELRRRLEMLWRLHIECAVEASGEVARAWRLLAEAEDRCRNGLDAALRSLFAARNRVARQLGWPGFHSLSLALGELEDCDTEARIQAAERETRGAWKIARGERAPVQAEALEGALPELDPERALEFLAWLGLPALGVRTDLVAEGMPEPARTYPITPPNDVRVVASHSHSLASARELWHELGHAAYAAAGEPGTPWSLATAPARCLDEGVAELFADLGESQAYLGDHLGLARDDVASLLRSRRLARLGWQRWQLARAGFERDVYRDPEGDLDARWRALVCAYVGDEEARAACSWTALAHLRTDPGSQLPYLIADRIRGLLAEQVLGWSGAGPARGAAASLQSRVLQFGAIHPWREVIASLGCQLEV